GWNGFFQLRAMAGQPLYSGYSPFFANNYPPLSFFLVGAIGRVIGDPILAGRLVSLAALAVIAWASGSIVRSAGGGKWERLLAIATCVLLFAAFATDYLGMNDPQLLAQACATAALAVYLGGGRSTGRIVLTALLVAISVMTKHNLILVPLLITGDVLLRGNGRQRTAWFLSGIVLAALSAALLWGLAGSAPFAMILAPRSWEVDRAFLFTVEILARYQAPIAVVGVGLYAARRRRPAGLILVYLIAAIAVGAAWSGGAGTDINVFFDLSIALAIGAGLAALELRERGVSLRYLAAFALLANAGALFFAPQALGRFGVDMAGDLADRAHLFAQDTAYLAAKPGPVLCQSQLLCLRAGKPMFYDSFNATQAMRFGNLPKDTLTGMLARHEIAVVQISDLPARSPNDPPGVQAYPARFVNFEDEVFDALARYYRIDRVGISGRFYVPK
ncbi:MAG: conserved rane protein of unknown function, partial [Novosphingobium sp.]|nr:conserved rane protein of unknown function [Novosphingobium sp.]